MIKYILRHTTDSNRVKAMAGELGAGLCGIAEAAGFGGEGCV